MRKNLTAILTAVVLFFCGAAYAQTTSATETDTDIDVTVDGKVLVKDKDYTLSYTDNLNVGTATVTVTFIGNYSGERKQTFEIVRKKTSSSSSKKNSAIVQIMQDDNVLMTTETSGNVSVSIPKDIEENSLYKVIVTVKGVAQKNKEVEILDSKGRTLRGRTDNDGIAYLQVVSDEPEETEAPTQTVQHKAYISGYEDGTFRPDRSITRAEVVAMMNRVFDIAETENEQKSYSDIKTDAWYYEAISAVNGVGIISGYSDGTFRPDKSITRAELVTMLMKYKGTSVFESVPFSDVTGDMWSSDYIYSAYKSGYVDGYEDGTFRPDKNITRAEAVTILNNALGRDDMTNEENTFTDVKNTHWAYEQILEASVEHTLNK